MDDLDEEVVFSVDHEPGESFSGGEYVDDVGGLSDSSGFDTGENTNAGLTFGADLGLPSGFNGVGEVDGGEGFSTSGGKVFGADLGPNSEFDEFRNIDSGGGFRNGKYAGSSQLFGIDIGLPSYIDTIEIASSSHLFGGDLGSLPVFNTSSYAKSNPPFRADTGAVGNAGNSQSFVTDLRSGLDTDGNADANRQFGADPGGNAVYGGPGGHAAAGNQGVGADLGAPSHVNGDPYSILLHGQGFGSSGNTAAGNQGFGAVVSNNLPPGPRGSAGLQQTFSAGIKGAFVSGLDCDFINRECKCDKYYVPQGPGDGPMHSPTGGSGYDIGPGHSQY